MFNPLTLLTNVFRSFSSWQGLLLIALIAFGAGSGSTLYIKSKFDAAARAKAAEHALEEQREAVRLAIEQMEELRALDNEILSAAVEKERVIETRYRTIVKEKIVYVPENPVCDLTRGAVGLLNDIRAGQGGLPQASGLSDEESRAPSTITQRAEVEAHADCARRYNTLAIQHNALIDWIEKRNISSTDR